MNDVIERKLASIVAARVVNDNPSVSIAVMQIACERAIALNAVGMPYSEVMENAAEIAAIMHASGSNYLQ